MQSIGQAREMTVNRPENDIEEQAFGWVDLLEHGPLSDERQREFQAWRDRSLRHQGAFVRASAASVRFDRLGALAGGRPVYTKPSQFDGRRRGIIKALALAATGVVAGGVWLFRDRIADTRRDVRYTTAVGKIWKGHLSDGSEMLLNTATELFVRYSSAQREVRLRRGEVMFRVTHDAERPFVVRVGEWVLYAANAAFAVRHDIGTVATVTEGSIDMLHSKLKKIRERLVAGQEATVDGDGVERLRHISGEESARRFAWRVGIVAFDGQPLREALEEMNRYSMREIRCADPGVCARRVVGSFPINDVQSFLSSMQSMFALEVTSRGNVVLLTPRKNSR